MYQRILVAIDGSPLSRKAIRGAVELAAALGAELVGVNVVQRYRVSALERSMGVVRGDQARIEQEWARQGQALADEVVRAAGKAGVEAKAVIVQSNLVAEAILAAARKQRCDLVVMASHGRKGLKRVLLGSETQNVLAQATLPVLVFR